MAIIGSPNPSLLQDCVNPFAVCAENGVFNTLYANNIIVNNLPIVSEFPVTGDGSVSDPITFAASQRPCQTFFWNGTAWLHNRNPGIVEVTIGNTATGANFNTIQEAFNMGCNFVRVTDDVNEPLPLVLPGNAIIYVDPGITLTLAPGQMDVSGLSLTILGNASSASSNVALQGTLLCTSATTCYFQNCHIQNQIAGGRSIIATTSNSYGTFSFSNCTFRVADSNPSFLGENTGSDSIELRIENCVTRGGGANCQHVIGDFTDTSLIYINGFFMYNDVAANGTVANTASNNTQLSNIQILSRGSDDANPFSWTTGGQVTNFEQARDGSVFLELVIRLAGTVASNLFLRGITIADVSDVQISNAIYTSGLAHIITGRNAMINGLNCQCDIQLDRNCYVSNFTTSRSLTIRASNCYMNNVNVQQQITISAGADSTYINNFAVSSNFTILSNNNVISNGTIGNNLLVGALGQPAFRNSINNIKNNSFVIMADSGTINNSFSGGVYNKFTIASPNNSFTGIQALSTFTIDLGGHYTKASNMRLQQVSCNGTNCMFDNCNIDTSMSLSAGLCRGTHISNCQFDIVGIGGTTLTIAGNLDVVISNCRFGIVGGVASSITGITSSGATPPAPGTTLITTSYNRTTLWPVSTGIVACTTF